MDVKSREKKKVSGATASYNQRYREKNPERILDNYYRKRFGISLDKYNEMLLTQRGVCAICQEKDKFGKRLALDHDHESGQIRGLLCWDCNTSLGKFRDSLELLRRAVAYLEQFSTTTVEK